jgi:exonuclease III
MWNLLLLLTFIKTIMANIECPNIISQKDTRINKNKLRIAQYNVEWLFIDYYKSSDCPGDGCDWKNESHAYTHLDYVAERIKDINPDIINFCEIEGCDELNILRDKLNVMSNITNGNYTSYLKKGKDTSTGQNVGMLTRIDPITSLYRSEIRYEYPIQDSNCGYTGNITSSGVSKHYITEFIFNNMTTAFISAHLVAFPLVSTRCAQREAQALVLQNIIYNYIKKNYEIIMLGDFNDYDLQVLDINENKPKSQVLEIIKGLKGDYKNEYLLTNVAIDINQSERYTEWYDSDNNCNTKSQKDYSMIDHILVSNNIKKYVNPFIYHVYDEYCGKYDSDHYPVIIDLVFN